MSDITVPRLTSLSHGAGCGCKIGPADLSQVLKQLPMITDPNVLVGAATSDDAAVYRVSPDLAMVVTADFFTPVVDDPYDFGRIAAANALSDVFAMGGRPVMALNLVAFPARDLPLSLLEQILQGGAAMAKEAGCAILGGHSIDDAEPKYGMVCIGLVHPDRVTANVGARPGDKLVLTKPLGIGILTTAIKRDLATSEQIDAAVRTMTTLNAGAAEAVAALNEGSERPVHAATDVTGFGLLGHLGEMTLGSGVGARLNATSIPLLDGVRELAEQNVVPGGSRRNADWLGDRVKWEESIPEALRWVIYDAQTSGGLLLSVAPESADTLVSELRARHTPAAAIIGTVTEGPAGTILVEE